MTLTRDPGFDKRAVRPASGTNRFDGLALPLDAAADATSLRALVAPLLAHYGFDSLSYFVTTQAAGVINGDLVWTTLPREWSTCYIREAHVALDPRLAPARRRITPFLWEAGDFGEDWRVLRFLADAKRHGIASGVVISLHDSPGRWVTVTFDAALCRVGPERRAVIAAQLGHLMLIAIALHRCIVTWKLGQVTHRQDRRGLTFRECDCLSLAARGLTSADIGEKLCVAERTVNFHFRNIKSKLGAINRPEAIARGISLGIVAADGD